jgi:glycosyltransferase involved in cell wall biosynthesis
MDQVAGHITNYRNLRRIADADPCLRPRWCEITYYRPGGSIETLREKYLPFLPGYLTGNLRAALQLREGLRAERYDAIFTNAKLGVLFGHAFKRTPTMVDFDATPRQLDNLTGYDNPDDPASVAKLKWHLCRNLFTSARLLQAWSTWARRSAIDEYNIPDDKVIVNPPGVDLSLWGRAGTGRSGDHRIRRVLFVGGDFRRKGGDLLLQWYREQRPEAVELDIVTREEVAPIPGVVVHHGLQPNSAELIRLYAGADAFVLPSLGECFGIATVEAMAAGLPVVASDVGGTADIVEQGGNGFITKAGDVQDLAWALNALLGDETRRQAMGRRSRELASQRFDLERNARRTLDHLRELASETAMTAARRRGQ